MFEFIFWSFVAGFALGVVDALYKSPEWAWSRRS
jgi:hypothetical protein